MLTPVSNDNDDCALSVKFDLLNNALHLNYEFINTSGNVIYLFNKLARQGGVSVFDIDVNSVNVILSSHNVVISKSMVPIPANREVERQYVPCLSRVEPDGVIMEHLVIPYPLSPFTWYASRLMKSLPLNLSVLFQLGYILDQDSELIENHKTPYGEFYISNWYPVEKQKLISADLSLNLPIFSAR